MTKPRVRVHLAASVDGYIAAADGSVDWLEAYPPEEFGFETFLESIGAIVMGRVTYDQVRRFGEWPYGSLPTVVVTNRSLEGDAPPQVTGSDDLQGALAQLKKSTTKGDIWICGGGRVVRQLLDLDLVDSLEIATLPVLLGTGLPLFEPAARDHDLRLMDVQRRGPGMMTIYEVLSGPGAAA